MDPKTILGGKWRRQMSGRTRLVFIATIISIALAVGLYLHYSSRRPMPAELKIDLLKQNLLSATPEGPALPSQFTTTIMPTVFRIFGNMPIGQRRAILNGQIIRVSELPPSCQQEIWNYLQLVGSGQISLVNVRDALITTRSSIAGGQARLTISVILEGREYPCTISVP